MRQSLVAAGKLFSHAVIRDQASFSPRRAIRREKPDSWQERCDEHPMSTHFKNLTLVLRENPDNSKVNFLAAPFQTVFEGTGQI